MKPIVIVSTILFAGIVFTGTVVGAGVFPLYQCVLVAGKGDVSFVSFVEGKPVAREARENEPWLPGEELRLAGKKGVSAKVAVSDLCLLAFDAGTTVRLAPGKGREGLVPPEIVLKKGSFFYKVRKKASYPLLLKAGPFRVDIASGAGYVSLKSDKFQAICGGGTLTVRDTSGKKTYKVAKGRGFSYRLRSKRGGVKKLPRKVIGKLARAFRAKLPEKSVPVLPDKVPPGVVIVAPKDGVAVDSGSVELIGTVNDPSVEAVKVVVQDENRGLRPVSAGQFRFRVKLYARRNTITVVAEDASHNQRAATVVVPCNKPLVRAGAVDDKVEGSALRRALEKLKASALDASNPGVFIALILASGFMLFIAFLIIRKLYQASKKSLQKASELATGIVFQRCEKCGNREYHYHLFYTTESVNSPFLRNLVNNVNPMATSMMNESLESLLSTGLKWSQKAKQAENKIRVICSWCDFCKTGTLSLEHMQGDAVTKVDDYQIIHPIFIEWVRKVYD